VATNHFDTSIELVRQISSAHDYDEQPLVSDLETLHDFIANKIEDAAYGDPKFVKWPNLRFLLACWYAWGDRETLKQWGEARINDAATLAPLLAGLLQESPQSEYCFLNPEWISIFAEPSRVVELARKLIVDGRQKKAVDTLVMTYDRMIAMREGKQEDPFGIWSHGIWAFSDL